MLAGAINSMFGNATDDEASTSWWEDIKSGLSTAWCNLSAWFETDGGKTLMGAIEGAWGTMKETATGWWTDYIKPAY